VGQPFEFDAVRVPEFEQPLVGDERVGALVIGVDSYARLIHGLSLSGRSVSRSEQSMEPCDADCHCKNEWAPVHSSIAGPCIFVLAKDFWYTPVVSWDSASAWPLRSNPADMGNL